MNALDQFEKAVHGPWKTKGLDVQYRVELVDDVVRVYFQCTKSFLDWLYDFWFTPTRGGTLYGKYRVHAGYLRVFESVVKDVIYDILDMIPKTGARIQLFGYSYGGSVATLLHLFLRTFWPNTIVQTWTFGAPRVFWGNLTPETEALLDTVTAFKVWGDIAAMYMPKFTGYRDVGNVVMIGNPRKIPSPRMHKTSEYRSFLGGYILGELQVMA